MNWIISANPKIYDLDSYLVNNQVVDWHQGRNKFQNGDLIYIYATRPEMRIKYIGKILECNIPKAKAIDDEEYWQDKMTLENIKADMFMRLQIMGKIDIPEKFTLGSLLQHGLNGPPQGPLKISEKLQDYLDMNMELFSKDVLWLGSEDTEDLYEGNCKLNLHYRYERNPYARERCIEYHGTSCQICGFDFQEVYGELGNGFIHVHHIVPLHTINAQHEVNYQEDLIPVCPNCHAMLHIKMGSDYCTVDELRDIVSTKRNIKFSG